MACPSYVFVYDEDSDQLVQIWRDVPLNDDLMEPKYHIPANFYLIDSKSSPVKIAWVDYNLTEKEISKKIRENPNKKALERLGDECVFNERPQYLLAEIYEKHCRQTKMKNEPYLAKLVVSRGKVKVKCTSLFGFTCVDDCGHMLGHALGGPMLHFNLFPQDRTLNRGCNGKVPMWTSIQNRITSLIKKTANLYCKYEVRLYYGDIQYPDRPVKIKVKTAFHLEKDGCIHELKYFRCETVMNDYGFYKTSDTHPFSNLKIIRTSSDETTRKELSQVQKQLFISLSPNVEDKPDEDLLAHPRAGTSEE